MSDTVDTAALTAWVREFGRLITAEKDHLTALDPRSAMPTTGSTSTAG